MGRNDFLLGRSDWGRNDRNSMYMIVLKVKLLECRKENTEKSENTYTYKCMLCLLHVPLLLTNSFIPVSRGCCAASTDLLTVKDS